MLPDIISLLRSLNQLLTAGIAITAFSLLLYALTFNLRDRVARSFALILGCVVIVFVSDAIASAISTPGWVKIWLTIQWVGIIFLPSTYLHFSDALLATTGRPSRGRRRLLIRVTYLISLLFLISLPAGWLVGDMVDSPRIDAPYLESTPLTWVFIAFYILGMGWALTNCWRALKRSITHTGRRRLTYLLAGAAAPSLGSFPYIIFGAQLADAFPRVFWSVVTIGNMFVSVLIVVMAYAVAFFGVSWPDRVVKRRLFKWLVRGPAAAFIVLAATTFTRRLGVRFGQTYSSMVPVVMVGTLLLFQYFITLAAPIWERWLFYGRDRSDLSLIQTLEERLLTSGDMKQFLETVLAAVCDQLQATSAYVVTLQGSGIELLVSVGGSQGLDEDETTTLLTELAKNGQERKLLTSSKYWIIPLFTEEDEKNLLLGFMGIQRVGEAEIDDEQYEALTILAEKAALALEDRIRQQQVFTSLESLNPQVEMIQRLRAASRFDSTEIFAPANGDANGADLAVWVKDALNHYWGGPKLTESPLMNLQIVQTALDEHQGNPVNALRAILRKAVDRVRPEGERRFTAEWILYNILEMKFMQGHKVRDVAMRLAMSEADLYRKQRVAIESVANALLEMEEKLVRDGTENIPS